MKLRRSTWPSGIREGRVATSTKRRSEGLIAARNAYCALTLPSVVKESEESAMGGFTMPTIGYFAFKNFSHKIRSPKSENSTASHRMCRRHSALFKNEGVL